MTEVPRFPLEHNVRATMPLPAATLPQYIRHAERFGSEFVYETALFDLSPKHLGHLAKHLRRIDKRWSLAKQHRDELIGALIGEGVSDREIREAAGVSQPTVREVRYRLSQPPEPTVHEAPSERNGGAQ